MHRALFLLLALLLTAPTGASAEVRTLGGVHLDGYLRTRFLGFHNLDLDNGGYSGVFSPLLTQYANRDLGSSTDFGSSFSTRLRVRLLADAADGFRIGATVDVVDDQLFGGLGAYPAGDTGLSFLSQGDTRPDRQFFRVKEVYGVFTPFKNVEIHAGREAWRWGTGMAHNDGAGLDADYGSYVDGVGGLVRLFDYEGGFSWDFAWEGAVSGTRYDREGQPHSLGNLDDVGQWRLWVRSVLPTVEWGLLNVFREQKYSSEQARWEAFGSSYCKVSGSDTLGLDWDCYALTPRGYFLWSPDVYVVWRPIPEFSLSAEVALAYGSIDHARNSTINDVSDDILAAGGFLSASLDWKELHGGLDVALATGGDGFPRAFGPGYDPVGDGSVNATSWNGVPNQHHFFFARDHHVDLLLFREIIGTFTNAFLVALPFSYDLRSIDSHRLRAGVRPIVSWAFDTWQTLGIETDAWLEYEPQPEFRFRLDGGYLAPLSALDNPYRSLDATGAFTFQLRAYWIF
jgi:uncharacterized protein (TIGR04551 family)